LADGGAQGRDGVHQAKLRAGGGSPRTGDFGLGTHEFEPGDFSGVDLCLHAAAQVLHQSQILASQSDFAFPPQDLVEGLFHRTPHDEPGFIQNEFTGFARHRSDPQTRLAYLPRFHRLRETVDFGCARIRARKPGHLASRKNADFRIRISARGHHPGPRSFNRRGGDA
jgi:hypothetical protein